MPAPKFRGDYAQLQQIAQTFAREARDTRQFTQRLKRQMQTLQGGDWVGKGATAFYQEMNGQVLPALNRLDNALENAARVTNQISRLVKVTEDSTARLFQGGLSGAAGTAAGITIGGGPEDSANGPASGAGGTAAGITIGGGPEDSANSGSGGTASTPPGPGGATPASLDPGDGGSTGTTGNEGADRMLAAFDPAVRDMIGQSPTLVGQLEGLETEGWTIVEGEAGKGSWADRTQQTIVIDPSQPSTEATVTTIAHEVGHAEYTDKTYHPPTPTMTHDEFIAANVQENLRDEGSGQFNAAIARDEIMAAGGPDIGIPGTQTTAYTNVYADYQAGNITQAEAVEQMANLMGNETTSNTGENYRQYYGKTYETQWQQYQVAQAAIKAVSDTVTKVKNILGGN